MAGAILPRSVAASSTAVPGDLAAADGSMLLMPIVPLSAVRRMTTHFVTFLAMPALVKVPASGMSTPKTSILRIVDFISCSLKLKSVRVLHRVLGLVREGPPRPDLERGAARVCRREEPHDCHIPRSEALSGPGLPGTDVRQRLNILLVNCGNVLFAFTGMKTKWMHDYSDFYVSIPSTSTPTIQEGHLILGHILCHYIEEKLENANTKNLS